MRALYAAMLDQSDKAPIKALRWHDKHRWIAEHPAWTFADYDNAKAGDILSHGEYLKMRAEAEKQALERAKTKDDAKRKPTR